MPNLLTLTYRSVNHYLVDCRGGKLLVDPGWAGSLPELSHALRRYDLKLSDIRYVLATHLHPDHAGLVQEVKVESGAQMLIHERQIAYLPGLAASHARHGGYVPITIDHGDIVLFTPNRAALEAIGVHGEVLETPGHSEDSVSLVLDSGIACVGDLLPAQAVDENQLAAVTASWQKLLQAGVRMAYHAHAGPIRLADLDLPER
jgi:endoribonuclease LACTB2